MRSRDRVGELREAIRQAAVGRWQRRAGIRAEGVLAIDAHGPGAADSISRNERFRLRSAVLAQAAIPHMRDTLPFFIERRIGPTLDFFAAAPSEAARKAGRPVARIVESIDPRMRPDGFATGFLVAPRVLMTNWHVFPTKDEATGAGANFLYERNGTTVALGVTFAIDPQAFYLSDERLDYALVGVAPILGGDAGDPALDALGMVTLVEATPKILIGQPVNLIEYPEGAEKAYATRDNRLLDVLEEGFLHYETDTLEGSSGSPAFSAAWELVALHHAAIPQIRNGRIVAVDGSDWDAGMGEDQIRWAANEGIRVSAIVQSLRRQSMSDPQQARILADLLASTVDPAAQIADRQAQLESSRGIVGDAGGIPLTAPGPAVGPLIFNGPVTIYIQGPAAAPATLSAPPAVAIEKTLRFDRNYDDRAGYDETFLGNGLVVPRPTIVPARQPEIITDHGGAIIELRYHHFSIVMNAARRLQFWSAVNVDYAAARRGDLGRADFGTDRWVPDPRLSERAQILDSEFYDPATQIDRGHIVRREDNAWGDTAQEIEFANSDTFHWTNCTPQHQAFNRDSPGRQFGGIKGLWGGFEKYVQSQLQQGDTRACILAGPVLGSSDPSADFGAGPVQYPVTFWKIVVAAAAAAPGRIPALHAYGFVLSQKDVVDRFGIESFTPGRFGHYRRSLPEITQLTGVAFASSLLAADQPVARSAP